MHGKRSRKKVIAQLYAVINYLLFSPALSLLEIIRGLDHID